MRHAKEEYTCNNQAIDLSSAVEELHRIGSQELNKLLRDSNNFTLQCYNEEGALVLVDGERLAWSLPLHLMAVLVSPGRDEVRLRYLLCGFRLLHSLSDLASRHTKIEQILLDEVKVTEQIIDLVFYMLIILAGYAEENYDTDWLPLVHSALVACSFHLLTGYISSQWQDLVHVLLQHPKVDVFMDVAFEAVRVDIKFLQIELGALNNDIVCRKYSPSAAENIALTLCQQCEASIQFLHSLCQQKLFCERLLKKKELCESEGILSLARAVLKLGMPPPLNESANLVAAVSRLKSKVLSILLQLCDTESVSYLDEVASSNRSMELAKSVALEVLKLLKNAYCVVQHVDDCNGNGYRSGLLLLNSMRLVDIFSDDSNFRHFITAKATHILAEILSLPHEEFIPSWCSTDTPLMEEDATLVYDPFVAAGAVLVSLPVGTGTSIQLNETDTKCSLTVVSVPHTSYAQQKTSLLVKVIANLHCFVPEICEEQDRNLFFNKFLECLHMEQPRSGFSSTFDTPKAARVCKNLFSLLGRASSLIPNFLNEEDVDLLSNISEQLQSLVFPSKPEATIQGVRSNGYIASPLTHKVDRIQWEVASGLTVKSGELKEETSESLPYQHDVQELGRSKGIGVISRTASESLREVDKDARNFETSGSDSSSTICKTSLNQIENGDFPKLSKHIDDSGVVGENQRCKSTNREEKKRRKRKRNIMNDAQIKLIEHALLDEPEMQRNAALLQSWADKLSVHGTELTPSQLKNWLNNRKAKLARVAKEAHTPSEGDNACLDKPSGSQFYDSPIESPPASPSEEFYVPSRTSRRGGKLRRTGSSEGSENATTGTGLADLATHQSLQQMNCSLLSFLRREPGQYVALTDRGGKEIGRGRIHQVKGRWNNQSLEETKIFIVDVIELKVDRWTTLPYPSDSAGNTFSEAEAINGVMRVAWDSTNILLLPQ